MPEEASDSPLDRLVARIERLEQSVRLRDLYIELLDGEVAILGARLIELGRVAKTRSQHQSVEIAKILETLNDVVRRRETFQNGADIVVAENPT